MVPTFRFGDWLVEPQLNRISRAGDVRSLEPKVMDVLAYMLARPGAVVSAADLLDAVWPGVVVEQNTVHRRIAQLRRALGDSSKDPKYVVSIPRRGYRAIAPVEVLGGTADTGAAAPASAGNGAVDAQPEAPRGRRRLGVLALRDLSADQDLGWLAGGLTEHLNRQIAVWPRIELMPSALMRGRSAGDLPAEVDLLIDGFIQGRGDDVHVELELVEMAGKRSVWRQSFHGQHADPFELQMQTATSIARYFGESTGGYPAPARREAYAAFLRALHVRFYGNVDDNLHWMERTLELDPDWSWGCADLAQLLLRTTSSERDLRYRERARALLEDAPRAADAQPLFLDAEIWLHAYFDDDLDGAERSARRFAERWGRTPYAMLMLTCGLHAEAEAYFRYVTEMAPYAPVGWEMLTMARANLGDWQGALQAARQLVRLFPPESINALGVLGRMLPNAGHIEEAHALLDDYGQRLQQLPAESKQRRWTARIYHALSFELAAAKGDLARSKAAANWFEVQGMSTHAGLMYLRTGDARADALLRRTPEAHFDRFWWWQTRLHVTAEQRGHPLFRSVEDALGFSHEWRAELAARAAGLGLTGSNVARAGKRRN